MLNVTTLISKHTDHRAFDAAALRRNDLRDLVLRTADPAERTGLLFRLAEAEKELEPLAFRLYGDQAARWHADAAVILTYAALAEQALHEARWEAVTDGASPDEVVLWEQLAHTPDRTERATIYRRFIELHLSDGIEAQLMEELALAEEHLAPGSPPHPHLVAAEREERRVRAAERVLLAAGLCALAIALVDEPDGPLFWLTLLSGLAAVVACRFGAHEAITRRASKGPW